MVPGEGARRDVEGGGDNRLDKQAGKGNRAESTRKNGKANVTEKARWK